MIGLLKGLFGTSSPAAIVLAPSEFEAGLKATRNAQLVDVRMPNEYKAGHLKGAKNINVYGPDFAQKVQALKQNAPVFLYCRSGRRSQLAAKRLKKLGFAELYDLEGGYLAWQHYAV